jgi:hypothetical protein
MAKEYRRRFTCAGGREPPLQQRAEAFEQGQGARVPSEAKEVSVTLLPVAREHSRVRCICKNTIYVRREPVGSNATNT